MGPWPCQSTTSRSSSSTCTANRSPRGAARSQRRLTQHPAAQSGRRRRQGVDGQPAVALRGSLQQVGRERVEGVGVGAGRGRRPGQRLGHAGSEGVLQRRQRLLAGPGRGRTTGRRCAGRPTTRGHAPGRQPGSARVVRRGAGGGTGRTPQLMPDSERVPLPRPSPSSTVSAWSSRVWPSRTVASSRSAEARSMAAYRALPGGGLRPAVGADLDPDHVDPLAADRPARLRRAGGRRVRAVLQAVVDHDRARPASPP